MAQVVECLPSKHEATTFGLLFFFALILICWNIGFILKDTWNIIYLDYWVVLVSIFPILHYKSLGDFHLREKNFFSVYF
jgi:hypothetical protein